MEEGACYRGKLGTLHHNMFKLNLCVSRMFSGSLQEEVTILEQEIEAVKDKVEDPMLCEKIRVFVYAPREIQELYKADAGTLISILALTR